ncbi:unnamed protein product [Knipowitschia caucasica]
MTEGMEDISTGTVSPTGSTVDTGQVPDEKAEETGAADEAEEGIDEGNVQEGASGQDEEQAEEQEGALALPVTCCVCIQRDQINNCLHSEKICLLPILACLLSLALCTAGLKWVFVDKIFEYEPPTHLDPKRIGQDPFVISADPTLGFTLPPPHLPWSTHSPSSAFTVTSGRPEVLVEDKSTQRPLVPLSPKVTQSDSSVTLKYNAEKTTPGRQTPMAHTTQGLNSNDIPTISATSTTTTLKTSSHVTRCSDSQKNYCVNGGECFTLEIMPGSTKFLCRCPNEFTGDRCQNYVMASFYKRLGIDFMEAEELYQKRILTITGICIALLVVGIMCVVAYCRTKKERKKLHDRLKQSLRRKRKSSSRGRPQLALQNLPNKNNTEAVETAAEKDAETSVSTSKCASSAVEPTALTHISQRYVFAASSPVTPGSPPSEMSAPLSSLAISVPSVALSPSTEDERPLLLSHARQHNVLSHNQQKRSSAHYNHGLDALSLPSSPQLLREHSNYNSTSEHNPTAASYKEISEKLLQTNNNIHEYNYKDATVANGPAPHYSHSDAHESEMQELHREHISTLLNGVVTTAPLLRATDSVRTTPGPTNDTPQVLSSDITIKQGQVAV